MFKFWRTHSKTDRWLYRFTVTLLLLGQVFVRLLRGRVRWLTLSEQLASVGWGSLLVIVAANGITGMLFVIQTARELEQFGALAIVGNAFGVGYCRELAPIVTASLLVGEVSSAFAAELGEMEVTDQIDALYMLRTNPVDYLVLPRVLACCIMLPVLTMVAIPAATLAAMVAGYEFYRIEASIFLQSFQESLSAYDLTNILLKVFIFGTIAGVVGCGWGLTTTGGAKGVSKSTKAAVVNAWLFIFLANFVLTLLMYQR
jgi:phospholipid/cholesterol/gamma-HCH transport system permease protein